MEIAVHGFPVSTNTRTVRMTLEEKGAEYTMVPVPYGTDEHAAFHPFRRIPIVEIGEERLIEVLAITGYIDDVVEGPSLQPTEPRQLARMRMWQSICSDYLFKDVVRGIPRDQTPTQKQLSTARRRLETVEGLLGDGPWIVDDQLTLADLYLAPIIANGLDKGPDTLIDGLPALGSWYERISERPSFVATDYLRPGGE